MLQRVFKIFSLYIVMFKTDHFSGQPIVAVREEILLFAVSHSLILVSGIFHFSFFFSIRDHLSRLRQHEGIHAPPLLGIVLC